MRILVIVSQSLQCPLGSHHVTSLGGRPQTSASYYASTGLVDRRIGSALDLCQSCASTLPSTALRRMRR